MENLYIRMVLAPSNNAYTPYHIYIVLQELILILWLAKMLLKCFWSTHGMVGAK